jgi:hypothetical protein
MSVPFKPTKSFSVPSYVLDKVEPPNVGIAVHHLCLEVFLSLYTLVAFIDRSFDLVFPVAFSHDFDHNVLSIKMSIKLFNPLYRFKIYVDQRESAILKTSMIDFQTLLVELTCGAIFKISIRQLKDGKMTFEMSSVRTLNMKVHVFHADTMVFYMYSEKSLYSEIVNIGALDRGVIKICGRTVKEFILNSTNLVISLLDNGCVQYGAEKILCRAFLDENFHVHFVRADSLELMHYNVAKVTTESPSTNHSSAIQSANTELMSRISSIYHLRIEENVVKPMKTEEKTVEDALAEAMGDEASDGECTEEDGFVFV